jgi:RHS repeat-associated protein
VDAGSKRLLGFSVFATSTNGTQSSTSSSQVSYAVDAAGNMTSDGLRTFVYDASNRLSKVEAVKNGDALGVEYLHNALGQRVFKSDPVVESTTSLDGRLDSGFIGWLKSNFGWMFSPGKNKSRLGLAFVYDEQGNLIAAYSNGSNAAAAQQMEVIWLPLEDGSAMPVGVYRNGSLYAVHTDHLGTPRLITDATKTPVWQWPYSAFGNNKPTGPLATITTTTASGTTTQLKGTAPVLDFKLGFPGQYCDDESQLCYNGWRSYRPSDGRYTQADRIGLGGGWNRFVYVGSRPLSAIDPRGLDLVLVTGGVRDGSLNLAGHTAIGVTGAGIFSYGNDTPLGSSVISYITSQSDVRSQVITIIPTTAAQDAAVLKYLQGQGGMNSVGLVNNCAVRTADALGAAGINIGASPFPGSVARAAAGLPGAQTYTVPQGTSMSSDLNGTLGQFAPPNIP